MKAALFDRIKNMTIIEKEIPEVKENEVLIKVSTAGICGSEVHAYIGSHPFRTPPSIMGHEVIGSIVKTGEEVHKFEVGDIVTIEPQIDCGHCDPCKEGLYNLCENKVVLGTQKWNGGFAEYLTAPEKTVYKIPKNLSPKLAVLVEPLAVGVHAAQVANIKKGDKVAILGSGPIGLLTAVAAHYKGAEVICLTDAVNGNLEIGKKLCATDVVNVKEQSIKEYAAAHIGKFDHVFLTVGHPSVMNDAFAILKRKGKIISIALFEEKVPVDMNQYMISEFQMLGSSMYVKEDFEIAIDILASQGYSLELLITHQYNFDNIGEAMDVAMTKSGSPIKVLVNFP